MNKYTKEDLLAKGMSSDIAEKFLDNNLNIGKFNSSIKEEMLKIFSVDEYSNILNLIKRKAIPNETIQQLLFESDSKCCLCNDYLEKPIIIHHIEEYAHTQNNKEDNLVVLCLNHHGIVHTKHLLSQNPYPKEVLKKRKKEWNERMRNKSIKNSTTNISINRLPIPSIDKIFGRKEIIQELKFYLNDANISIVSIVADGGVGKSSLVFDFLNNIFFENDETINVFGWSFYSQGSHDTYTNSSLFFNEVLDFLKFDHSTLKNDEEKAYKLSEILNKERTLLILDGIESLQYKPNVQNGWINDIGLKTLLINVSRNKLKNNGLILVTSRQSITEIKNFFSSYKEISLEGLKPIMDP